MKLRERVIFLFDNDIIICRLKPKTTAETIASNNHHLNAIVSGTISLINHFKGSLVFKGAITLSDIKEIKIDNFDEKDHDRLFIELILSKNTLDHEKFSLNESCRPEISLNEKILLKAKNQYSKFAFIKNLDENLFSLGYLKETLYSHDNFDLFEKCKIFAQNKQLPKKRKILSRKQSHDKINIVGDSQNDQDMQKLSSPNKDSRLSNIESYDHNKISKRNDANYFQSELFENELYPIVNYTALSPQSNKESKIIYSSEKNNFLDSYTSNLRINDSN